MKEWKEYKFSDIAYLKKITYLPAKGEKVPYIGLEHINEQSLTINSIGSSEDVNSNKFIFESDDVLFGKLRPYFRKVYNPKFKGICSTDIWVLKTKKGFSKAFLFYFVANPVFIKKLTNATTGTRMPRADWSFASNTKWLIPSFEEQQQISNILSSLDNKIDLLRRQNETLEAIAQTLFKRWFVEFEFPNKEGQPYKSSGGKMVSSELGEIPAGWRVIELSELVETITKGTTPTTLGKKFVDKGINFIKAESITSNHTFDKNKFAHIDEQTDQLLNRSKIQQGDFLYTIAGTIGRFAVVTERVLPANTNQAIAIIRLKKNLNISPYQLLCYLKSHFYQTYLRSRIVQAVQANLSLGELKNTPIILAENSVQSKFSKIAKSLFNKIEKNEELIGLLVQTRDILLPKLMSGQIRVK